MSFLPTRVDFGECRRQFIGFYGGAHVAAVNQISDARMQITVFEVLNTRNISWKGENILNLWYIYLESALAQMAMVPWINLEIDLREFGKKKFKILHEERECVCAQYAFNSTILFWSILSNIIVEYSFCSEDAKVFLS